MQTNEFIDALKELNIDIDEEKLKKLENYYKLLIEWNEKINLTGITEKKDVYLKHFYDSLTLNKYINLKEINSLCDIGTGAGFPGIVLKIVFPNIHITLVDSLNKRIIFLKEVINELQLKNIEVYNERAEEYAKKVREKFDLVTCRAVARLPILLEYSIPLVKVGGIFAPLKASIDSELINIDKEEKILNIKLEKINRFYLPIENSERTIPVFKKLKETDKKYPRKYSDIKKKPL